MRILLSFEQQWFKPHKPRFRHFDIIGFGMSFDNFGSYYEEMSRYFTFKIALLGFATYLEIIYENQT